MIASGGIAAALLGSRSVRLVGGLAIVVVALVIAAETVLWAAGKRGEIRGANRVIVETNIDAEKKVEKAIEAGARADRIADPVAELRKRTCPGCK